TRYSRGCSETPDLRAMIGQTNGGPGMLPRTAHRISLFFGFVVLALTVASVAQPSPPVCGSLPARYAPIIAFELARSVRDLHAIFGALPGACRTAIAARLDFINWTDSLLFIPVYGAFLVS